VVVDTNWDGMEGVVIYFERDNHSICLGVEDDHMKPASCCRFFAVEIWNSEYEAGLLVTSQSTFFQICLSCTHHRYCLMF